MGLEALIFLTSLWPTIVGHYRAKWDTFGPKNVKMSHLSHLSHFFFTTFTDPCKSFSAHFVSHLSHLSHSIFQKFSEPRVFFLCPICPTCPTFILELLQSRVFLVSHLSHLSHFYFGTYAESKKFSCPTCPTCPTSKRQIHINLNWFIRGINGLFPLHHTDGDASGTATGELFPDGHTPLVSGSMILVLDQVTFP